MAVLVTSKIKRSGPMAGLPITSDDDGRYDVTVCRLLRDIAKPVHILTPAATVRRIINMTAVASAHAAKR